jgi:hypothetical protein
LTSFLSGIILHNLSGAFLHFQIGVDTVRPGRVKHIDGHGLTAPERYAPDTRHMVLFTVIIDYAEHKTGDDNMGNKTVRSETCSLSAYMK